MTQLNKISSRITQPKSQGASQAMLYATGMSEADMGKAQVGIGSVWYDGNPCNMHLNILADLVKTGVREAGLVEARQEAQRRVYSLRPAPLAEVDQWLGRYRSLWEQRLDALHTEVARGKRERRSAT